MVTDARPDPLIPVPQRTSADTEGRVSELLAKLEASGSALKVVRMMANSPGAFRPFVLMADALLNRSRLPARERELVILDLAARRGVRYEWSEHVPMSRAAGVTDAERDRLADGRLDDLSSFSPREQVALRTARAIVSGPLTPAQWREATDAFGDEGATDLLLSVGWWGAFIPLIVEATGLVEPGSD